MAATASASPSASPFPRRRTPARAASTNTNTNTNTSTSIPNSDEVVDEEFITQSIHYPAFMIPDLFTEPPLVRDDLITPTSKIQDETVDICLPFLDGETADASGCNVHGVPHLNRKSHVRFLHQSLGRLPSRFLAADPSRPWFLYWSLAALTILGEDVSGYRHILAETARSMQNDTGGFGGGGQQTSHMATTYAVVLALALVGGEEAFEVIDRKALWKWLGSLKQPDGGFEVCLGGEEDIRGAYCAAVIISLLNIPLDLAPESPAWAADGSTNLLSGVGDYVRRCQTFEGGISGQPNAEAHGAYAFCALGCLALLGDPRRTIPRYLDVPRLVSWLSSRQYAPEGGFSGRTNKLVDGCYSHWVGGCFPLIEACLSRPPGQASSASDPASTAGLPPVSESLFNREGLIRYILCCCQDQSKRGGLRDKPGKMSDAYHSCYVLSGLSSAQHQWELAASSDKDDESASAAAVSAAAAAGTAAEAAAVSVRTADPVWTVLPHLDDDVQVFELEDLVRPIHPVYAIPQQNQQAIQSYFLAKEGF